MSTTKAIIGNTLAVVLYQSTDARGRQVLEARTARGKLLHSCRSVASLAGFVKSKAYQYYEYNALPKRTQEALDALRAAESHRHIPKVSRPTMGEVMRDQFHNIKERLSC